MAEKKKTDIDLPFLKVKEDEEGSYVKIGPFEVIDKKEKVKIGMERSLNTKLEVLAWAFFFILIGCVWLFESVYNTELPGMIAIGIGVIWLGLNYARHRLEIETSTGTIVLGIVAIIYGVAQWFAEGIDLLPLIVIAIGVYIVFTFARKGL